MTVDLKWQMWWHFRAKWGILWVSQLWTLWCPCGVRQYMLGLSLMWLTDKDESHCGPSMRATRLSLKLAKITQNPIGTFSFTVAWSFFIQYSPYEFDQLVYSYVGSIDHVSCILPGTFLMSWVKLRRMYLGCFWHVPLEISFLISRRWKRDSI